MINHHGFFHMFSIVLNHCSVMFCVSKSIVMSVYQRVCSRDFCEDVDQDISVAWRSLHLGLPHDLGNLHINEII